MGQRAVHLGKLALRAVALGITLIVVEAAIAQNAANLDNANCLGCHGSTGLSQRDASGRVHALFVPAGQFAYSVHGKSLRCIDCHAAITELPHMDVPKTPADWVRARLAVNKNCGNCHAEAWRSYAETYHGQVARLGYGTTATCSDCHGTHAVRPPVDPASSASPANILQTCRNCHANATAGFATFQSHATTDDLARYPYMWIASKFVLVAVGGVLVFFLIHSALWFYRELRDRQQGRLRPHVRADAVPQREGRYYQRWSALWIWAHLLFALSIILLVMTGIPLQFADTGWAQILARMLGGPAMIGLIHRIAAVLMTIIFVAHIVYIAVHIARNRSTFKLFGSYSLMPNLQDGRDFVAMFKWFFGRSPRPTFDHWTYQQKIDYWAPFWGITLLAATGVMLWFTALTATYLPGWTFNIAAVVHGDEALLAAIYLFTVHYFSNHWRPDKFPLDIVIFVGAMPLEEFKREYAVEYSRLLESGELDKNLVDAPSRPMTLASKVIGFALVAVGVALLIMMLTGIGRNLAAG
jgi:cytochrome b subunit of formate dehydrogenase/nitrate/TMAO reductase-like tetraheme cytochrome c subunit